jgi:hypothetical protein
MKDYAGGGGGFRFCGIVANLPVSAIGIAQVISPGVPPDTQRVHFTLPVEPGGY